MKKLFLLLSTGVFVCGAGLQAQSPSRGQYDGRAMGFYLGHFDSIGRRTGCQDGDLRLSRGGEPQVSQSAWQEKLHDEKVDYILDLRSEANRSEENAARAAGLGYILLPLSTSGTRQPSSIKLRVVDTGQTAIEAQLEPVEATVQVLQKIGELTRAGHRVYIHCQRGEDRTGIFVGLLRKCDSWKTEFRNYGGSSYASLTWLFDRVSLRQDDY